MFGTALPDIRRSPVCLKGLDQILLLRAARSSAVAVGMCVLKTSLNPFCCNVLDAQNGTQWNLNLVIVIITVGLIITTIIIIIIKFFNKSYHT